MLHWVWTWSNQSQLKKGSLGQREALLGLKASEGTSVWVFRGFLLTPGRYFSAAVERPFRVFWELLFFSNASCPFACLSFRQQPPGKCYRQQQRICRERQEQELSQENAHSFCSLLFYSILVCFNGLSGGKWGNEVFESVILAQIFWRRVFREKNRTEIWEGFGVMLPGKDNGRKEGDFPASGKGNKLWKKKKKKKNAIVSWEWSDIMWRRLTGQGNPLRSSPMTIVGQGSWNYLLYYDFS